MLEQVDRLQSTTEENIQLAQKVAKLERQVNTTFTMKPEEHVSLGGRIVR